MISFFINLSPVWQALIAGLFTYGVTALGASFVFLFKKVNRNIMDAMLGFAGGVMISATFWSLLSPAIDLADNLQMTSWFVVSIGFICGGLLLFIGDKICNHLLIKNNKYSNMNSFKRCLLLIVSITLHNIPEGCNCYVSRNNLF